MPTQTATRASRTPPLLTEHGWLYHQYVALQRSRTAIAAEVGCSKDTVTAALTRARIPLRDSLVPLKLDGVTVDDIEAQIAATGSQAAAARAFGVHPITLRTRLRDLQSRRDEDDAQRSARQNSAVDAAARAAAERASQSNPRHAGPRPDRQRAARAARAVRAQEVLDAIEQNRMPRPAETVLLVLRGRADGPDITDTEIASRVPGNKSVGYVRGTLTNTIRRWDAIVSRAAAMRLRGTPLSSDAVAVLRARASYPGDGSVSAVAGLSGVDESTVRVVLAELVAGIGPV